MSLLEVLAATVIIVIGVAGVVPLVVVSMGANSRSRQESNSVALAQMMTEKIASVKASTSPTLTISDCTGANFTVSTTAPGGSTLLSSGAVDYSQAAVTNYQMLYTDCATSGTRTTYDIRWNLTQPSAYTKLLTVSAKKVGSETNRKMISLPVTIRTLIGQGT